MCKHCDEYTKKMVNDIPHNVIEKEGKVPMSEIALMLAVNTTDTRWLKEKVKEIDLRVWGIVFTLLITLLGIWLKGMV